MPRRQLAISNGMYEEEYGFNARYWQENPGGYYMERSQSAPGGYYEQQSGGRWEK